MGFHFENRRWSNLSETVRRNDYHYGEGIAQRTCAAADRTGHVMLHTLYQQSHKYSAEFFIEFFAIDLIMIDGECRGVVALETRRQENYIVLDRIKLYWQLAAMGDHTSHVRQRHVQEMVMQW